MSVVIKAENDEKMLMSIIETVVMYMDLSENTGK